MISRWLTKNNFAEYPTAPTRGPAVIEQYYAIKELKIKLKE